MPETTREFNEQRYDELEELYQKLEKAISNPKINPRNIKPSGAAHHYYENSRRYRYKVGNAKTAIGLISLAINTYCSELMIRRERLEDLLQTLE